MEENVLERYFYDDEIMTSSELINKIVSKKISRDNARQIIRRNCNDGIIWRSKDLKLPKNERLFALQKTVNKNNFFMIIGKKLKTTHRKGFSRCLCILSQRTMLHKYEIMKLLAVSDCKSKESKRQYYREKKGLKELGLKVFNENTIQETFIIPRIIDTWNEDEILRRDILNGINTEILLTRILCNKLRQYNLCSWEIVELPDTIKPYVIFNKQMFSAYGISYISPLVRWNNDNSVKGCPVLIDVYHKICTLEHVKSFIERVERATIRGKSVLKTINVISARDFTEEAFIYARRKGLLTINFRQMFGTKTVDYMEKVAEIMYSITNSEDCYDASELFNEFIGELIKIKTNPIIKDLRSIGFEVIVGFVLRSNGYERVNLGKIYKWGNTTRDVDVFGIIGDELRIIECKAYHRKKYLVEGEVKKFFTETVSAIKKYFKKELKTNFKKYTAEIWTTGKKGEIARKELYNLKKTSLPKTDEWKLLEYKEIIDLMPDDIKQRAKQLLESISLEELERIHSHGQKAISASILNDNGE